MDFADRLKELRENSKMTQEELAKVLGVGRPTIAGYETKGKQPSYEILSKLSEILHCTTDYLLGRSEYRIDSSVTVSEYIVPDLISQEIIEELQNNEELKKIIVHLINLPEKDKATVYALINHLKSSNK